MSAIALLEGQNNMRSIISVLIVVGCVTCAESETVPLWGRFEAQLANDKKYTNPFKDVQLNATCDDDERLL